MARIDYKDGLFLGLGTWTERTLWEKAGFTFSRTHKAWVTDLAEIAERVKEATWTQAALDHQGGLEWLTRTARVMSYADSTAFRPPVPPGLHPRTGLPFEFLGYQAAGVEYALQHTDVLIADAPGLGKGGRVDTPVLTPTGWKTLGDLWSGDEVLHPYHGVQKVLGVYDRGVIPNYKVTFSDGSSTICSGDHLWTFRRPPYAQKTSGYKVSPAWETLPLEEIEKRFSKYKSIRSAKIRIPQVQPLEFSSVDHIIHPYLLGVILGDGGIKGTSINLTSADYDFKTEIEAVLHPTFYLSERSSSSCAREWRLNSHTPKINLGVRELKRMGLMGTGSGDKFIPKEYLFDSLENRRALLQGLLDTDGYVAKDGTIQYSSNSRILVQGVRELVWSLGGVARLTLKISASGKDHWITTINLRPTEQLFRFSRKTSRVKQVQKYPPCRMFDKIERVDDQPIICIKVSQPDGLYVTDDYIVTHNTVQAVGLSNCLPSAPRILVIAPASLKANWEREWKLWDTKGMTVGIAETSHKVKVPVGFFKNGRTKYKTVIEPEFFPDTDVVIINPDILPRFEEHIKGHGREWDLLVVDESHSLKNPESNRTLFVLGGRRKEKREGDRKKSWYKYYPIKTTRRCFLTGTPILNKPIELWPVVHAFDPKGLGLDWEKYAYKFCGAWWDPFRGHHGSLDTSGATNKAELGQKLREAFMVRRLKKDVLKDLPDKCRHVVLLDSPDIRALVQQETELAEMLHMYEKDILGNEDLVTDQIIAKAELYGFATDEEETPRSKQLKIEYAAAVLGMDIPTVAVLFDEIAKVRRDLGLAKMSATLPWINEFLEGNEDSKLVIFAYHTDVIKGLAEELAGYNPAIIYGQTPVKKRQPEADRFQLDESCRVILLNIQAGGVGYTLTRAADVVFVEGDWTPSNLLQAEDRVHRIGQKADKIAVYYLMANGSLDARIAQSSKMKEDNINEILDT